MKVILLLLFFVSAFVMRGFSQVTKLYNNNSFDQGIQLGNIMVLGSENDSIWRTDGTPAGTFKVSNDVALDTQSAAIIFANKIYFTGTNAASGGEVWVTDGTSGGTQVLKEIQPGATGSEPGGFHIHNNVLYFYATSTAGRELWKTNGTEAGTSMVKDINPGAGNGVSTTLDLHSHNGLLYFLANDGTTGEELWKSDGTDAGTVLVKNINPGAASSSPAGFTPLGTDLIFAANDGTTGRELWKTNGSEAGTVLVKDIASVVGSSPSQFVPFNNKIYFTALNLTTGLELYATDGTTAGTDIIKDIEPGEESGAPLLFNAIVINNKLYFQATTTANGTELWSSDGTTTGTQLFTDINAGSSDSNPFILPDFYNATSRYEFHTRLYNGKIFFEASNGTNGTELWVTDGTLAGTVTVKDINPGPNPSVDGSFEYFYTASGLYFAATDGSTGIELWKSDGTNANTNRVIDINPGAPGSLPSVIGPLNDKLIFTAHDGDNINGLRDLYKIDGAIVLPLTMLHFNAALSGKSVRLNWSTSAEINGSHFELERSINAVQFEKIGMIASAGNSAQTMNYNFTDSDVKAGIKKYYYRLKKVDKDGKFTYSKVEMITLQNELMQLYTYPNPVVDNLILVMNANNGEAATIQMTSVDGRKVFNRQIKNVQGENRHSIDISSLSAGVYYLRLTTRKEQQSLKLIKQ